MGDSPEEYQKYALGSRELIDRLVADHLSWASSIARTVARAWNMDWQLDGLDGGAYEGLVFCASRYDPSTNVPFRAYARRRVHQAATEEARKSKAWQRQVGSDGEAEQAAREISACLFELFPELRDGVLPVAEGEYADTSEAARSSIRQLLISASLFVTSTSNRMENPEKALEYKSLFKVLSSLELVHQQIMWSVYWLGISQRSLAEEWELDELAVIREHKEILGALHSAVSSGRTYVKKLKIRPVLRSVAERLKKAGNKAPFASFSDGFIVAILAMILFWFICAVWLVAK